MEGGVKKDYDCRPERPLTAAARDFERLAALAATPVGGRGEAESRSVSLLTLKNTTEVQKWRGAVSRDTFFSPANP